MLFRSGYNFSSCYRGYNNYSRYNYTNIRVNRRGFEYNGWYMMPISGTDGLWEVYYNGNLRFEALQLRELRTDKAPRQVQEIYAYCVAFDVMNDVVCYSVKTNAGNYFVYNHGTWIRQ